MMIPTPKLTQAQADAWRIGLPARDNWDLLAWYKAAVPTLPDPCACVEVGVAYGRSLLYLASELVRLRRLTTTIYGVDPWGRPPPPAGAGGTVPSAEAALGLLYAAAERGELELIRLIGLPICDAARAICPCRAALVMLDGDHTYTGTRDAIISCVGLVAPGGVLAGHDYGDQYPGVAEAVDELLGRRVRRWERMWWVEWPC